MRSGLLTDEGLLQYRNLLLHWQQVHVYSAWKESMEPMDSGIVALLVEVENAKVMTGKNFLINLNGFSLVKRNNST